MYNIVVDPGKLPRADTLVDGTDMAPIVRGWVQPGAKGSISQLSQETKGTEEKDVALIDNEESVHADAGNCSVLDCGAHALTPILLQLPLSARRRRRQARLLCRRGVQASRTGLRRASRASRRRKTSERWLMARYSAAAFLRKRTSAT